MWLFLCWFIINISFSEHEKQGILLAIAFKLVFQLKMTGGTSQLIAVCWGGQLLCLKRT